MFESSSIYISDKIVFQFCPSQFPSPATLTHLNLVLDYLLGVPEFGMRVDNLSSMRFAILIFIVFALFFSGCTSLLDKIVGPSDSDAPVVSSADDGNLSESPAAKPVPKNNGSAGAGNIPAPNSNTSVGQIPLSNQACDVGFQLSSTDTYLVKVNYKQAVTGVTTVLCSDGTQGVAKGGDLFLCEKLNSGSRASAFLNGALCGTASFNAGSSQPAPTSGSGNYTCDIRIPDSKVFAGGTALVEVSASSLSDSNVILECGRDSKAIGSGLVSRSVQCTFDSVGISDIVLYIDSKECAREKIEVLAKPATPRQCSVKTTSKDFKSLRFEGLVSYSGFDPTSTLKWDCFGKSFTQKLGSSGLVGEMGGSGSITIYCQYTQFPAVNVVPVSIDSVACGSLEVR